MAIADAEGWEESAIELVDETIMPIVDPEFQKPEYVSLGWEAKRLFSGRE